MKKWTPLVVSWMVAARLVSFDLAGSAHAEPSLRALPPNEATAPRAEVVAESPVPVPEASNGRTHRGFYLAAQLGGGYLSIRARSADGVATITGPGMSVSVSVGAAPVENLVIHGDITTNVANKPTMTYNDSAPERHANTVARLWGFGGGATYFIMPLNVYLGGSLLLNEVSVDLGSETIAQSKLGIGGAVRAGKQFWLGESWALDLGALFHAATMSDRGSQGQVTGWSLNLLAGVSLN